MYSMGCKHPLKSTVTDFIETICTFAPPYLQTTPRRQLHYAHQRRCVISCIIYFHSIHTNHAKHVSGGRKIINKNEKYNNANYRRDAVDRTTTTDVPGENDFFNILSVFIAVHG